MTPEFKRWKNGRWVDRDGLPIADNAANNYGTGGTGSYGQYRSNGGFNHAEWEKYKEVRPWTGVERGVWPNTWLALVMMYHANWHSGTYISDRDYYYRLTGEEKSADTAPVPPATPVTKQDPCRWQMYCGERCEDCIPDSPEPSNAKDAKDVIYHGEG